MSASGWRHRDHTSGNLLGSLLMLALPLIASSTLGGAVFQLVDLTFLSRLGEQALSAVVITNQSVRQVAMMVVMGASFATQSLIARAVGGGDFARAEHLAGQSIALGACFATGMAALGLLFPDFLFSLAGPDPSFAEHGVPYTRLVFALNFGIVGTMLFGAILGGAGDTTTPLLVQLFQTAVAITAEWILIFGQLGAPALGVRGAALGVATGQVFAIALGLWVLFRGKSRVHLRRRHVVPDRRAMAEIVRIAWPPALQMIGGVATNFAFIRLAGGFGEHVQSAYAIGLRLGMVVPMVCFPLASACATLVGQALGAGDPKRAWRAVGAGLLVHGTLMFGFAVATLLFRREITGFFSDDPVVVAIGSEYLFWAGASFFSWAFYFIFLRALQGAGDFLVPMAISLGNSLLVTIPLGFGLALGTDLGERGIWIASFVGSLTATLGTGLRLAGGRWAGRGAHS